VYKHRPSTAYTEYYILHRVLHHRTLDSLPLPASLSSVDRLCCTEFSTFPQLWVNKWIESQLPTRLPPKLPPPDWPPPSTPPISLHHALQSASLNSLDHNLQVRTIMASKYISSLSLNYSLQVRTLMASKCISPNSLDHGLQVHLQSLARTIGKGWENINGYQAMMNDKNCVGSMNAWQVCVRNHRNCVDPWKLGKGAWDQEMGKKECVFCIMQWCLSTQVFPNYILPVAEFISGYIYIET